MPAHIVSMTSSAPGAGKTLVAAALCRWLRRGHHPVCPFVACGDGRPDARSLQVLACAAGLLETLAPAGGTAELAALAEQWDYLVVECGPGVEPPPGPHFDLLSASASGFELLDAVSGETLLVPSHDTSALFPEIPPALARLPEWTYQNAPRVGIISLPHLSNFADFRLFRGAEWISSPPPGLFHLLIVPASADEDFDRGWLSAAGLDAWLQGQREQGCSVLCTASPLFPGQTVTVGALQDFRAASIALGRRLSPPDPEESELDALAVWIEQYAGAARLRERCLGA
ncbi:MAG: hypothetical protein ABSC08_04880 [Bryobacteraceae bacterium]